MNTRVNPNILQYSGIGFWLLAMLFHQSLVFKGDNQVSELSNIIYLIIIGTFAVSFYKYYVIKNGIKISCYSNYIPRDCKSYDNIIILVDCQAIFNFLGRMK